MNMKNVMEKAHLDLAKELIELKFNVKLTHIEFEDGTGKRFIVSDTTNPLKKRFIRL